jgi:hypothetical protein
MKKVVRFVVAAVLFSGITFTGQAQDRMKSIVDTVCNCLSKKDMSKVTRSNAQQTLMECFLGNAMNDMMELAKERGVEMSDQEGMEKLGYEIGQRLVKDKCEPAMKLFMKIAADEKDAPAVPDEGVKVNANTGKLIRTESRDFVYFVVQDAKTKKTDTYIWLSNFPGSEEFLANPAKWNNKNVTIEWKETEVYSPKKKAYVMMKEVTGLSN